METVDAAALQLSPQDRAEVIEPLIDTVLPPSPLHPEWEVEIARRVAEMDTGRVEGIPAQQVFARMRALIEAHVAKR